MMRIQIVAISAIFGVLAGCATSNERDVEAQQAARTELLAQQNQLATQTNKPARVFPVGTKEFIEPDFVGIKEKPCDGSVFALNELTAKIISLSNRDVFSAVELLETMGYHTISHDQQEGEMGPDHTTKYACSDLPIILVPRPHDENNLVINSESAIAPAYGGPAQMGMGTLGFGPLRKANAYDLDQVLVFYHHTQIDDMVRFEQLLRNIVDTPSPQVYIETMVLEVSEEDSKELGVAYQTATLGSNSLLSLGSLGIDEGPTVDYERNTRQDEDGNFEFTPGMGIQMQIKALVDEGKAEILARPRAFVARQV